MYSIIEAEERYLYSCIDISFFIMFHVINTMKKHKSLLYHVSTYDTKKIPI